MDLFTDDKRKTKGLAKPGNAVAQWNIAADATISQFNHERKIVTDVNFASKKQENVFESSQKHICSTYVCLSQLQQQCFLV